MDAFGEQPVTRFLPGAGGPEGCHRKAGWWNGALISMISLMSVGVFVRPRRRPTPGALYVGAIGAFAVLLLALSAAGLVAPLAVVVVAVPLGPIGVAVAGLALPSLAAAPSPAVAAIVLAVVLAIAAANVMIGAVVAARTGRRLDGIRERALTAPLGGSPAE